MAPLAPGLFSTTKVCFSASVSACARMRPYTSVPPPGDEGTTSVTGRAGQSGACAQAPPMQALAISAHVACRIFDTDALHR